MDWSRCVDAQLVEDGVWDLRRTRDLLLARTMHGAHDLSGGADPPSMIAGESDLDPIGNTIHYRLAEVVIFRLKIAEHYALRQTRGMKPIIHARHLGFKRAIAAPHGNPLEQRARPLGQWLARIYGRVVRAW